MWSWGLWNEWVHRDMGGGDQSREDWSAFDRDLVPVALLDLLHEAVVAQQAQLTASYG